MGFLKDKLNQIFPWQRGSMTSVQTKRYKASGTISATHLYQYAMDLPDIRIEDAEAMIIDPVVNYALALNKGPIRRAQVEIVAQDPNLQSWIERQFRRYWDYELRKVLRAVQHGWHGAEIVWKEREGYLELDYLREFHPVDVSPMSDGGCEVKALKVRRIQSSAEGAVILPFGKFFWNQHDSEYGNFYGRTQLRHAWPAWYQKWDRFGCVDSLALWFRKYAFSGWGLYYPDEDLQMDDGTTRSARSHALNILEQMKNGAVAVFPGTFDAEGRRLWELIKQDIPSGTRELFEYPTYLDDNIRLGIGTPPEITDADGTGAFAGRLIPQEGFYTTKDDQIRDLVDRFDRYIVKPGIKFNRDRFNSISYELKPQSVVPDSQQSDPQAAGSVDEGVGFPANVDEQGNPIPPMPQQVPPQPPKSPLNLPAPPQLQFSNPNRAPSGGISIDGKRFLGGEFIPAEYVAKATPAQQKRLAGKSVAKDTHRGFSAIAELADIFGFGRQAKAIKGTADAIKSGHDAYKQTLNRLEKLRRKMADFRQYVFGPDEEPPEESTDEPGQEKKGRPKSKEGKLLRISSAMRDRAEEEGIDPITLRSAVEALWEEKRDAVEETESVLRQFRKDHPQFNFHTMEKRGDMDKFPKFDRFAADVVANNPGLFDSDPSRSPAQVLWDELLKGKQAVPAKNDPELIDEAVRFVKSAEDIRESFPAEGEDEDLPFSMQLALDPENLYSHHTDRMEELSASFRRELVRELADLKKNVT